MKDWWNQISLKEKQTIGIGCIIAGVFLVYQILLAPIANKTKNLREKISHNQNLLSFMQQTDLHIQALEKKQPRNLGQKSSLLSATQNAINKSSFESHVTQLQKSENNSVRLNLQKINFDNFMKWLTTFCLQQNLTVTQMSVVPNATPGIVDAQLQLQSA